MRARNDNKEAEGMGQRMRNFRQMCFLDESVCRLRRMSQSDKGEDFPSVCWELIFKSCIRLPDECNCIQSCALPERVLEMKLTHNPVLHCAQECRTHKLLSVICFVSQLWVTLLLLLVLTCAFF